MSANKKLNEILLFLNKDYSEAHSDPKKAIIKFGDEDLYKVKPYWDITQRTWLAAPLHEEKEIDISDINLMLDFLYKEERYIDYFPDMSDTQWKNDGYRITYKGRIFIESGGYINAEKTDASKKRIQNLKDWLLIVGSLGAMTGALALAASEGIKLYAEHNKYFCLYADTTGGLLVLVLATILLYRK